MVLIEIYCLLVLDDFISIVVLIFNNCKASNKIDTCFIIDE